MPEEERDADAPEPYAAVERVPPRGLRAVLQDVAQLQRHHAQDRVVLAVPLVSHRHRDHGGFPVADEPLRAGVEDGLGADGFGASAVDQLVVQQDLAVAGRQLAALFVGVLAVFARRFILAAFAVALAAFDVGQLQVHDLVDDDAQHAAGPERVRRRVRDGIFLLSADGALLVLELGHVLEALWKVLLLAVRSQLRPQLGLAEESDFPVQLARHLAALVEALQFGDLGVHPGWVLEHIADREFHFTHDIVGRGAV